MRLLTNRRYRIIDFGRTKRGTFGEIETIEYDPYRNARICLVNYEEAATQTPGTTEIWLGLAIVFSHLELVFGHARDQRVQFQTVQASQSLQVTQL